MLNRTSRDENLPIKTTDLALKTIQKLENHSLSSVLLAFNEFSTTVRLKKSSTTQKPHNLALYQQRTKVDRAMVYSEFKTIANKCSKYR